MGARQSSVGEERPRSSSVDGAPSRDVFQASSLPESTVVSEILQSLRRGDFYQVDTTDDDEAGPSSLGYVMRTRGARNSSNIPRSRRRSHTERNARYYSATDITCPVCRVTVPSDEADLHLVLCLTRPRIDYNSEVLTDCKGECAICLDDMEVGHSIARLPCLCIYHKECIDNWFTRKNCCPEHPGD
ncbi:unnamed protein product [Auanema sp. JU1783]|nr:unnamed protein product [Auanema sp. JU1783]